jgi:ankyrin repeat protein
MATCGNKFLWQLTGLVCISCSVPQRISDPKLIENERFINACAAGDLRIVIAMLGSGTNVNAQSHEHGSTCLHFAAFDGDLAMVELLLKRGASVAIQDRDQKTPLFDALYIPRNQKHARYDKKVISILLAHGAAKTINITNPLGAPIYWACRYHDPDIVKLLLEYGADPNYDDGGRYLAYHCMKDRSSSNQETEKQKAEEIWKLLQGKGAKSPE